MANDLQIFEQSNLAIFQKLAEVKKAQEQMKAREDELKAQLKKSMEDYSVTSFKNEYITISYVKGTTSESIDITELEKKEPELYKDLLGDYPKITTRKPYVKFLVK